MERAVRGQRRNPPKEHSRPFHFRHAAVCKQPFANIVPTMRCLSRSCVEQRWQVMTNGPARRLGATERDVAQSEIGLARAGELPTRWLELNTCEGKVDYFEYRLAINPGQ